MRSRIVNMDSLIARGLQILVETRGSTQAMSQANANPMMGSISSVYMVMLWYPALPPHLSSTSTFIVFGGA